MIKLKTKAIGNYLAVFTRNTVSELAGKVCLNFGPLTFRVSVLGETLSGPAREFSSVGISEVNTMVRGPEMVFAPARLICASVGACAGVDDLYDEFAAGVLEGGAGEEAARQCQRVLEIVDDPAIHRSAGLRPGALRFEIPPRIARTVARTKPLKLEFELQLSRSWAINRHSSNGAG